MMPSIYCPMSRSAPQVYVPDGRDGPAPIRRGPPVRRVRRPKLLFILLVSCDIFPPWASSKAGDCAAGPDSGRKPPCRKLAQREYGLQLIAPCNSESQIEFLSSSANVCVRPIVAVCSGQFEKYRLSSTVVLTYRRIARPVDGSAGFRLHIIHNGDLLRLLGHGACVRRHRIPRWLRAGWCAT